MPPARVTSSLVEHRESKRVPFAGRVCFVYGGRRLSADGRDFSTTGMSFYVNPGDLARGPVLQRFVLGSTMRLFFELPGSTGDTPNHALGRIVRFDEDKRGKFVALALEC